MTQSGVQARDVLLLGPPGSGRSHVAQALEFGSSDIKNGPAVLSRSISDVVRDFLHDKATNRQEKIMARYLSAELVDKRPRRDYRQS